MLIEREDVAVMFKRVADEQDAIARGMAHVEAIVIARSHRPSRGCPSAPDRDRSRPAIEFYRRRNVIDLLLPVI